MDKETRNTLRLGLFVLVGAILLIIAVYFIGSKQRLFSRTFSVYAHFNDVNGLQAGDNIRFRGINVGTVKHIEVSDDSTVKVVMLFDKGIKPFIHKNAEVSIVTDGLMGNKIINIRNGKDASAAVEENDVLKTIRPIDMEDVARKLNRSNDNISTITDNLTRITDKINKGKGVFGELLTDTTIAKNLREGMRSLRSGASNINQESEALKHNFLFKRYFKKQEKEKETSEPKSLNK